MMVIVPVLELDELVVDIFDVDVLPAEVEIGGHTVDDVVVEPVEFLQQVELFADAIQLGHVGHDDAEQLGAAFVGRRAAPQGVEAVLEEEKPIGSVAWYQALDHGSVIVVIAAETVAVHPELAQVVQQFLSEVGLDGHQVAVVIQRARLQPVPRHPHQIYPLHILFRQRHVVFDHDPDSFLQQHFSFKVSLESDRWTRSLAARTSSDTPLYRTLSF